MRLTFPSPPTPRGLQARPTSYAEIERNANYVRKVLMPDLPPWEPFPGVAAFERLDRWSVDNLPLNYHVHEIPAEGMTLFDPTENELILILSTHTYSSLEAGDPRALFTLCHELGHVALHSKMLVQLGALAHDSQKALHRGTRTHKDYEDTEWQANAFGSALCMPASGLRHLESNGHLLSPELLTTAFKVSHAAATVRLNVYKKRRHELI